MELFHYLLAGLTVGWILLVYANIRWASPIVAIINRWLRWGLVGFGGAAVVQGLEWSDRPYWALAGIGLLSWLLAESMLNWFAIKALSQSPFPLFPRFTDNSEAHEWPAQKRFLHMRQWLRDNGFERVQSLKCDLGIGMDLRSVVFQTQDKLIRLQITFIPQRSGALAECCHFVSHLENGARLITDNLFTPFGGFYPDDWEIVRRPRTRSIERLYREHKARMEKRGEPFETWEGAPMEDINLRQRELERLNTDHGFLFPPHLREEHGKITSDGCYRVWKELWFLNYFGRSGSSTG